VKQWVVDTSVVAAAFFAEKGAKAATRIIGGDDELLAPDLIQAEFGNVVWKRYRLGEVEEATALALLSDFQTLPIQMIPTGTLLEAALQLAMRTDRTVYDCLFLALAIRSGCQMVTNDRRMVNALKGTPVARHIRALV